MVKPEYLFIEKVNYSHDLTECFKARYSVYCVEKKWLDLTQYKNEIETDELDAKSKHIIVYNERWEVKGYTRMIICDGTFNLPVSYHPGIKDSSIINKKLCEASRFISVNNNYKTAVTYILLRALYQLCLNYNFEGCYMIVEEPLIRYIKKIGFVCKVLSEPCEYFGNKTIPVKVLTNATDLKLRTMSNLYGNWFFDDSPFISKNDFIFNFLYSPTKLTSKKVTTV